MCGRFTQKLTWKEIHALYRLPEQAAPLNLEPRYNGCPTQDFAACRLDEGSTRIVTKLPRLPQLTHDFDDFSSFDSRNALISLSPIFVIPL